MQTRAEVRATREHGPDESVVLDTAESVLVDWPFAPLASGEHADGRCG